MSYDRWAAVLDGDAPIDWELWASPISGSGVLSRQGKATLHRAVETISRFLGPAWLSTFTDPRRRLPTGAGGLPLLSTYWWPVNDTVHVYRRILELAARLTLLETTSGIAQVRKDMRGDLGHFAHGVLQLEVGALALRSGWTVVLEPIPRPGAKTDLRLSCGAQAMLVEAKDFRLDTQSVKSLDAAKRLQNHLLGLEVQHDVYFAGDFDVGEQRETLDDWFLDLTRLAAEVAASHEARTTAAPNGGQLRIVPGPAPEGTGWSVPVRRGDEWQRIRSAIAKKAEQARGTEPLWLRFDETSQFWHLSSSPDQRLAWLRQFANAVAHELVGHRHVAGVLLSAAPASHVDTATTEIHLLDSRAVHLTMPVRPPFVRESLIVSNPRGPAPGQTQAWLEWYRQEGDWLPWAHEILGLPPLHDLFLTSPS
jgi:hypothetical protein